MSHLEKIAYSIILILVSLLLRALLIALLNRRRGDETNTSKRWINTLKNSIYVALVMGLLILWLSEVRFFALSIAAFGVAIVIATREFIQCILGSLYLASARSFDIGDWIQVDGNYGEVVRSDWLSTTLLEIDIKHKTYAHTGKTLFIPNNQFMLHEVNNLNFMRRYIEHSFTIVRESDQVDVTQLKAAMLANAKAYCEEFKLVAERYNALIEKRLGVKISLAEPSIRITTNDLGKNLFTITLFCPTQSAVEIEQKLIADFMSLWYQKVVRQ